MDSAAIAAAYAAIPRKDLQRVLLVEYRCRHGCLLLHVWQSPMGPTYCQPRPPLSDPYTLGRLLEQAAQGDIADRAGLLDDCQPSMWIRLMCNHVAEMAWVSDIRRDLAGRTPGKPAPILWPKDTPSHFGKRLERPSAGLLPLLVVDRHADSVGK
jgi:hypothetical protein